MASEICRDTPLAKPREISANLASWWISGLSNPTDHLPAATAERGESFEAKGGDQRPCAKKLNHLLMRPQDSLQNGRWFSLSSSTEERAESAASRSSSGSSWEIDELPKPETEQAEGPGEQPHGGT